MVPIQKKIITTSKYTKKLLIFTTILSPCCPFLFSFMKQISDKITLIPLSNIKAQYKQSISIKDENSNYSYISCSPVQFAQVPNNSSSGIKFDITHSSVCNKQGVMLYHNKNIVARMTLMNRDNVYIGTLDIPAKVTITPYEGNLYKVEIQVSLPYPLDL